MSAHVVVLYVPEGVPFVYGPFVDYDEAAKFAEFATAEIDPAKVTILRSPTSELLAWRKVGQGKTHPKG